MKIFFDENAKKSDEVKQSVERFLSEVETLESQNKMPILIFQDGVNGSYYIKCNLRAGEASRLCDLNAKLDTRSTESYRANRELLLKNATYLRMVSDAEKGREFNDIIVEYNSEYNPDIFLKVWGGQHRIRSISEAGIKNNRYHGFRIYFNLSKKQRTEVALISNTNISVSNDTFDRMIEETTYGDALRKWCREVRLLNKNEDFPDIGSRSERISVKLARSFIVNFYLGKGRCEQLKSDELDRNVYEPYITQTGALGVDPKYKKVIESTKILEDENLLKAGKRFADLHHAQHKAITEAKGTIKNIKSFKNKALIESVLTGWSYVAGLLQAHTDRLQNHYRIPRTNKKIPDPLNAKEMSEFKHSSDPQTYRGLGARSDSKDRQRIAQLFLAKSCESDVLIDKRFMEKAVSQAVGIIALSKGYKK